MCIWSLTFSTLLQTISQIKTCNEITLASFTAVSPELSSLIRALRVNHWRTKCYVPQPKRRWP